MKARVLKAQNKRSPETGRRGGTLKGYEGVFIPKPPKLAVVHLSSGDSEEMSGHSERFSGYSEHSAEKTL